MERTPLTFRVPTAEDIPVLARLSYHSFPSAQSSIEEREKQLRESPLAHLENRLVAEAGGRVVAALNGIEFTGWVGGVAHKVLGVAGVAIAPDARRRGYAAELVTQALRYAQARGVTLSALYPFRHEFYAKVGYGLAVERRLFEIDPCDLPSYPERARVAAGPCDDIEGVMDRYRRVMERSTLMLDRSEIDWRHRILAGDKRFLAAYADGEGVVRGYFVYRYEEFADGRLTRLFVPELVYENQDALRGLLGYIGALKDQFREVAIVTGADERLELRLRNPRSGGAVFGSIAQHYGPRVLYGAMARVVDVPGALRAQPGYNGVSGSVRLVINDTQLAENCLPFDVTFTAGTVAVEVAHSTDTPEGMSVATMEIGLFSQLYLSAVTASEAAAVGLLTAERKVIDLLDRAFAGPRPSLMDHF